MPSMGYCKFENTCLDMEQCIEHIENHEPTSEREVDFANRLKALAEKLIEEINYRGIKEEKYDDDDE
tara:strand:+ start:563 stop:763 length:201 start_codon:yes stop_codon:yes gene_type:complete